MCMYISHINSVSLFLVYLDNIQTCVKRVVHTCFNKYFACFLSGFMAIDINKGIVFLHKIKDIKIEYYLTLKMALKSNKNDKENKEPN